MQRDDAAENKKSKAEKAAVKAMVRIRPFSAKELKGFEPNEYPISVISMADERVDVIGDDGAVKDSFEFHNTFWSIPESQKQHHVFKPFATQETVFQETGAPAVANALKGYHTCIFAYGQTGSGKTHTMLGSQDDPGLAPRLIETLFSELELGKGKFGGFKEHVVEISFMEIYNENVKDLFIGNSQPTELKRRKSRKSTDDAMSALSDVSANSKLTRRKSAVVSPAADSDNSSSGIQSASSPLTKDLRRRKTMGTQQKRHTLHVPGSEEGGSSLLSSPSGKDLRRRKSELGIQRKRSTIVPETSEDYKTLRVRQSPIVGTFVEGLIRLGPAQGILTADDVKRAMTYGMEHRSTAATQMNETSSRSHAIFQICVRAKNNSTGTQRYSHINLVDLAGSERIKMSGALGDRLTEATKINLSLGTLRRVIDALIENATSKKKLLPPYRDSMLTWILSESLGGNSKTVMIATVSPATSNREDSVNTLRYALKAKSIVNTVRVNEQKVSIVASAMMREINELREQLQTEDQNNPEGATHLRTELEDLETEYNRMEHETKVAHQKQEEAKRSIEQAARQAIEIEQEVQGLKQEGLEEKHSKEMEQVQRHQSQVKKAKEKVDAAAMDNLSRAIELEREKFQHEEIQIKNMEIANRKEAFHKEMLVVKRKQFAAAFQKAFKHDITHTSKHKMADELKETSDRINDAHQIFEQISDTLLFTKRYNEAIRHKIRTAESEYSMTEHDRITEDKSVNTKVKKLQKLQQLLETDTQLSQNEANRLESMYLTLAERRAKDNHRNQESVKVARQRLESVESEKDYKQQLVSQLKEQSKVMTSENTQLRTTADNMDTEAIQSLKAKMAKRSECAELAKRNKKLTSELQQILAAMASKDVELSELKGHSTELQDCQEGINVDHVGLRHFVSGRFFPPGRENQTQEESPPYPSRPQPFEGRSASRTTSPNTRSFSNNRRSVSPSARFHRFAPPIASSRERS